MFFIQNESFPAMLSRLREQANLSTSELARLSGMPRTYLASIQSGKRSVGEKSARKLARVLGLAGEDLEAFVLRAINGSAQKVLASSKQYPAFVLNLLALHLADAGVRPQQIVSADLNHEDGDRFVKMILGDGSVARIGVEYATS